MEIFSIESSYVINISSNKVCPDWSPQADRVYHLQTIFQIEMELFIPIDKSSWHASVDKTMGIPAKLPNNCRARYEKCWCICDYLSELSSCLFIIINLSPHDKCRKHKAAPPPSSPGLVSPPGSHWFANQPAVCWLADYITISWYWPDQAGPSAPQPRYQLSRPGNLNSNSQAVRS